MKLILRFLINFVYLMVIGYILNIFISFYFSLFVIFVGLIFALFNSLIRPAVIALSLPANILTLGVFTFVLNFILFLLSLFILDGFSVDIFKVLLPPFAEEWKNVIQFGLIFCVVSWMTSVFVKDDKLA